MNQTMCNKPYNFKLNRFEADEIVKASQPLLAYLDQLLHKLDNHSSLSRQLEQFINLILKIDQQFKRFQAYAAAVINDPTLSIEDTSAEELIRSIKHSNNLSQFLRGELSKITLSEDNNVVAKFDYSIKVYQSMLTRQLIALEQMQEQIKESSEESKSQVQSLTDILPLTAIQKFR